MTEQIQEAFWLTSADYQQLLYVSPAFETIWGRSRESLYTYPGGYLNLIVDSIHPNDRERVVAAFGNLLEAECKAEYRLVRPDGSIRWVRSRSFPVQNPFGETWGIAGLSEDITERKQAEEILYQREQQFRTLVEHSPDIIARFDRQLRYLYVSPAVEAETGQPPEDYLGKTFGELGIPEPIVSLSEQSLRHVFQTGEYSEIEFSFSFPDQLKYYQSRFAPEFAADGSVEFVLEICRDITKNKQTEAALRESEEGFRTMFEAAPIGIVLVNSNGRFLQTNPTFQELFGYTDTELQNLSCIDLTHPEHQVENANLFQELFLGKRTRYSLEKRCFRKDGCIVWASVCVSVVCDASGLPQYAIGMIQDISDRKHAELKLFQARDQLEQRVAERTAELEQANIRLQQEIAERSAVQEALKSQQEFLRAVLDINPNIIFVKNREGKYTLANQAYADFYGMSIENVLGKTDAEVNPNPEDVEQFLSQDQEVFTTLQQKFIPEQSCYTVTGERRWYQTIKKPLFSSHGQVSQILGIATDITRRKQAELELQQAKEQLRAVLDAVPGYVSWISAEGRYLGVNRQLADSFNLSPDAFVGKELGFLKNSPEFTQFMTQFLASSAQTDRQVIEVQVNGSTRSYLIAAQKYQQSTMAVLVGIDITERKQAEEALKAQKEFLQTIIDNNPNVIFVTDTEGKYVLVNQIYADSHATTVEDVIGKTAAELHPNQADVEYYTAQDKEVIATLRQKFMPEELYTLSGEARWYQTTKKPLFSSDGQVCQILGVATDITERKLAQEELKAQKEFLQIIIDTNPNRIFVKDREGKYILANKACADFHGIAVEDLLGHTDAEVMLDPADVKLFVKEDLEVLTTLQTKCSPEVPCHTPTGEVRWWSVIKKPLLSKDGQAFHVFGVCTDITERKLAEEQVRESESQLRLALEAARMDSWNWNFQTGKIIRSNNFQQLYGFTPNPSGVTYEEFLELVHPEDRDRIRQTDERALETGDGYDSEFRIILPDGSLRWVQSKGQVFYDETGKAVRMAGVNLDISDRKLAEEQLRQSEEQLRLALDAANMGFWDWNLQTGKVARSSNLERLYGWVPNTADETKDRFFKTLHPDDYKLLKEADRHAIETGEGYDIEFRIIMPDGSIRWLASKGQVFYDESGLPVRMAGINLDISDRKFAEEQLRQSQALLHLALDAANMGFWEWNLQTGKVIRSQSLQRMLGWVPNTADDTNDAFLKILHPDDHELFNKAEQHAIETGEGYDIEFRILLPDGSIRWLEAKGRVIYDETGNPARIAGIDVDISERKLAEIKIKESLQEKEVLLQEIHHRVKNNLQVISSLLDLQSQHIQNQPMLEIFRESQSRIRSMALVHEKLYQSKDCAKIIFVDYVETLTSYLFQVYGVKAENITLNLKIDDISLNIDTAIPCGLIINELVSNSLKYAFPNRKEGVITVIFQSSLNGQRKLIVKDNGIGLSANFKLDHVKSLGLKLVNVLTKQIEGTIAVNRNAGTEFRISFLEINH
ncbi:PAS domain S-box protein [Microcoleus sp. FACHB-SPT15]|nr:PAS domain S-box protein [Microcoleus sp. FACHB-SPT15]